MNHLKYWKLAQSPFTISGSRRNVFVGGTIEEALARCEFLLDQLKQLGLVIGPTGVGKTTLLDQVAWSRRFRKTRERITCFDLRFAGKSSLATKLGQALELESSAQSQSVLGWTDIQDHLFSMQAMGHRVVLLLDNITNLSEELIGELFQGLGNGLSGSILMSVDDEGIADLPRWIVDQCELKIELPRWDLGQTADFFEFVIRQSAGKEDLFDGQSITRIQELSDGIPRKIAQIAELALVAGAVRRSERVTAELVDQVCDEFTVSVGPKFPLFWEDQQLNAG